MKFLLIIIKRFWWIIVILLIIAGFIINRARNNKPIITEYTATREDLTSTLEVSGTLEATKSADLKFQAGGRLAWVGVVEGQRVSIYQAIASLDIRSIQKTLEKELSEYMTERWDFEDTRDDYDIIDDNLNRYTMSEAARRVLERSQFSLDRYVLDVEIQAVSKEFATIIAPFDGIISDLSVKHPNINVAATDIIATIVDPNTLYFSAEIDELDIGLVAVGQEVELVLDAYPDEVFYSTIVDIGFSPVTLSGGGTGYEVVIAIPTNNDDLKYKLGMNGDADIVLSKKEQVVVLPIESVMEKEDGKYISVRVDNEIVERLIQTGIETEEYIEVTSGVREGEVVVTSEKKK